ncbi:unnamed protein product [Urochloa decumbens]|uniref:Uncharacterized protein n=1 Tax=Urochloa decumbens TaxID=240449 RepID=A0ABC9H3D6_9POAL
MEDVEGSSAGSSSHQHGDCASAGSSSHQHRASSTATAPIRSPSPATEGPARRLSHQHGDRRYPRWTGARLRYSRSLPGRLSGGAQLRSSRSLPGRLSEIMAPLQWPEPMMDYFVDECFKMVQGGRTPANETFFRTLDRSMARKSFGTTFSQMDLTKQFERVKSLWNNYHTILKNLEMTKAMERQSQTYPEKLHLKTGDIYARKFTLIRKYEIKLNTIFESYYDSKAKSLSTYRYNIEHSDRYSGDSNSSSKRRSLGEPFSRQIRLKSSDMPESSQNGSASEISEIQDYDKAMGELINKVDDGTYVIAGQCLRDPKILQSYSHIPTIERKISFLHGTWRVMHEPKCVLENLQSADQLFVRSPNS